MVTLTLALALTLSPSLTLTLTLAPSLTLTTHTHNTHYNTCTLFRFLRLKHKLFTGDVTSEAPFSEWIEELLKQVAGGNDDNGDDDNGDDDENGAGMFQDSIEPGEQERINGAREPGQPPVGSTRLKKCNASRSWLFEKYFQMEFVDKNPEGDADDEPLEDESLWERRLLYV